MKTNHLIIKILVGFNILLICSYADLSGNVTNKVRIAIIGLHDQGYNSVGKYAHLNKIQYAKKHTYGLHLYNESLDLKRSTTWSKILALEKHIDDYDWLFWLDSDALIMDFSVKLESLIDNKYDLIASISCNGNLMAGNFLIKNSPSSKAFLKEWYNPKYLGKQLEDNAALIKMYKTLPQFRNRVKLIHQSFLSSYYGMPCKEPSGLYKPGHFIIHFAGQSTKSKANNMKNFYIKSLTINNVKEKYIIPDDQTLINLNNSL